VSRKDIKSFRVKLTLTVNCQYSTVSCLFGDLVIYDLPDSEGAPKRRTRLHKLLSAYRKWTQYSADIESINPVAGKSGFFAGISLDRPRAIGL
jgi:hypothetical protein